MVFRPKGAERPRNLILTLVNNHRRLALQVVNHPLVLALGELLFELLADLRLALLVQGLPAGVVALHDLDGVEAEPEVDDRADLPGLAREGGRLGLGGRDLAALLAEALAAAERAVALVELLDERGEVLAGAGPLGH